jgi:hypothetical protein
MLDKYQGPCYIFGILYTIYRKHEQRLYATLPALHRAFDEKARGRPHTLRLSAASTRFMANGSATRGWATSQYLDAPISENLEKEWTSCFS